MAYLPNEKTHIEKAMHDGNFYFIAGHTSLNDGDEFYVQITTDSNKETHFYWEISSNTEMETQLYENVTAGVSGGTSVTPINANRNSSNTSGASILKGITVDGATFAYSAIIDDNHEGLDSRRIKAGLSEEGSSVILKKGTVYVRKFLSHGDGNVVNFRAMWIEEED